MRATAKRVRTARAMATGRWCFVSNVDEDEEEGGNGDDHGNNEGKGDEGEQQR